MRHAVRLAASRCRQGDPDPEELRTPCSKLARDMIKMVAYTPERTSALEAIKIAVDHGVVAAVGHTEAS
jgi:N-acetylglucosamine-6-phosphate deacetylase